jgi:hypothetical protein
VSGVVLDLWYVDGPSRRKTGSEQLRSERGGGEVRELCRVVPLQGEVFVQRKVQTLFYEKGKVQLNGTVAPLHYGYEGDAAWTVAATVQGIGVLICRSACVEE